MNKEEYLLLRNSTTLDTMPVLHFFYNLKNAGKQSLSLEDFRHIFTLWLQQRVGIFRLGEVHYFVFKQLDKHFNIN